MGNRQFLKMVMRGEQPRPTKLREFFVLDGKVHLANLQNTSLKDDLTLVAVTCKADLEVWKDFANKTDICKCNRLKRNDVKALEAYRLVLMQGN